MPLETSNKKFLNLPFKSTGSRSLPPYLRINGNYIINKKEESITLQLKGKDPKNKEKNLSIESKWIESKLDRLSSKVEFQRKDIDIIIRLDKKNYTIGGKSLFDSYVESEIITNDLVFNSNLFNKLSKSFFIYVKKRKKPEDNIKSSINEKFEIVVFEIVVLPSKTS